MSHAYLRGTKPIPTEIPPITQIIGTIFTSSGIAEKEHAISSAHTLSTTVEENLLWECLTANRLIFQTSKVSTALKKEKKRVKS